MCVFLYFDDVVQLDVSTRMIFLNAQDSLDCDQSLNIWSIGEQIKSEVIYM